MVDPFRGIRAAGSSPARIPDAELSKRNSTRGISLAGFFTLRPLIDLLANGGTGRQFEMDCGRDLLHEPSV